MAADVSYFGIRHHGPGSARRLLEALSELGPAEVLVEGPADLSDQLPLLASHDMIPPVALLAYQKDAPEGSFFWPFAVFSPEYQAICWAIRNGVPVRFIDLPVAWRLAREETPVEESADAPGEVEVSPRVDTADSIDSKSISLSDLITRDPIGALAYAAGYEDGESWWRDVIEENPAPGPIFSAVSNAMSALRAEQSELPAFEAAREAHMRIEIAASSRKQEGPVAVVCGAWHVPALQVRHPAREDRGLLKGGPKAKITATWAPWTSPRLAFASGYGAGVTAPGWCRHLWDNPGRDQVSRWIAEIAHAIRQEGHVISTASLIEAERLSIALAAIRGRPRPGFEELREAVVACLCFGDPILWQIVENKLLLGNEVGSIPENVPAAPLLEDLQRQQRKAHLKAEALDRELSLDLRSESGLLRSTLLHRLLALDVPWGRLTDAGKSRGTFRERWVLAWKPEYAVQLVENLIYGRTVESAAAGRLANKMHEADTLGQLAELVFAAMSAQLAEAVQAGTARLEKRAAESSDCLELLGALPGLADVIRYGMARQTDATQLTDLFSRIGTQGALALHYAARNLDADAAHAFAAALKSADGAIRLAELEGDLEATWMAALRRVTEDRQAARLVTGASARLLYEADAMSPQDAVALLGRMLSPGMAPADAAAFFEGFFEGSGQRLLYDADLRARVDEWMVSLDGETFTEYLPLFRRVLSELDRTERKRLLDALIGRQAVGTGRVLAEHATEIWPKHFETLTMILRTGVPDGK